MFRNPSQQFQGISFFSSPTPMTPPNSMSNLSIFPPFLLFLFYSSLILSLFPFSKQFSDPNLVWYCLKTAPIQLQTVPLQVLPQISSPLTNNLLFCNCQKITNKNSHNKIILFSNNSFAILGIPYSKMISSSSLRKRKALNEIKSALSSGKSQKSSLVLLESKVAMPTKLNRKASQEPESWCNTCQHGSPEGQIPTQEIPPK